MSENNFNIQHSSLGKSSVNPEKYDASLLFRIPRIENREKYGISNKNLPFSGVDVWNCYEVSFLLDNGLPVNRMLKLIYSCESEFLVESKSLKLYLNSFNMERLGATMQKASEKFIDTVRVDLENELQTAVAVQLFTDNSEEIKPFAELQTKDLVQLISENKLSEKKFNHFLEAPGLLEGKSTKNQQEIAFRTDVLRSNCRVTNQPDWGDLFVKMISAYEVDLSSVLAYLISFRQENHFHEEVVEMIYKRLWDKFQPQELMVAAMYTRRGGIDINPIRVSETNLLDEAFISTTQRLAKTLRQ